MNGFDIAKNIYDIDKLKCQLLEHLSDLYQYMLAEDAISKEKEDILSSFVISLYRMANKLNVKPDELDKKIYQDLKITLLNQEEFEQQNEWTVLLKHFEKKGK